MLIRNILEESARKFDEVKAVKWLNKKEIMERSYGELMENVVSTRKGGCREIDSSKSGRV